MTTLHGSTRSLCAVALAILTACVSGGGEEPSRASNGALAVSRSKLGPHHLQDSGELRTWIAACPKVLKVFGPDLAVIHDYRARCDGGKVVVRVWVPPSTARYSGDGDGRADAQDFWSKGYGAVRSLSSADKAQIDYLESANEFDNYPPYKDPSYYNAFQQRFAEISASEGFHPLVGNIAVGNPDGDLGECDPSKAPPNSAIRKMRAMLPSMQTAASLGGGWSYHAYTLSLSKDVGALTDFAFRYRRYVECIPELRSVPLILTESGLDQDGDPDKSGWQARADAGSYVDWLRWFDGELQKDDYVIGATVFAIGGDGWRSFQLGPIVPQLVSMMNEAGRGAPPAPPPVSPPPVVGVGGGAIGACFDRNGGVGAVGGPFDNGGGAAVHRWGNGEVQDFHGGALGPNLCMHRDGQSMAWMVRGAIRDAYFSSGGAGGFLGFPLEDEATAGGVPSQRFEGGYVTWKDGGFQAFAGATPSPPPPPPPPPPSCGCVSGKDNFCLYGPSYPDCAMTAPGGYCDPNGDGDFSDADWTKGWYEHHDKCG